MASRSWNRVELIGNLTRDVELRYTPNGAAVATFSIATNRSYVSEGERKEEVDFFRVVAWNKLAELCSQLLKKGIRVFVSGRLQNRSWEGQDGVQRNITEIVLEDMIVLSPRTEGTGSFASEGTPSEVSTPAEAEETDVPGAKSGEAGPKAEPPEEKEDKSKKKEAPKEDIPTEELDDLPF